MAESSNTGHLGQPSSKENNYFPSIRMANSSNRRLRITSSPGRNRDCLRSTAEKTNTGEVVVSYNFNNQQVDRETSPDDSNLKIIDEEYQQDDLSFGRGSCLGIVNFSYNLKQSLIDSARERKLEKESNDQQVGVNEQISTRNRLGMPVLQQQNRALDINKSTTQVKIQSITELPNINWKTTISTFKTRLHQQKYFGVCYFIKKLTNEHTICCCYC